MNTIDVARSDLVDLLDDDEREQSVVISDPSLPDNPIIFVSPEFERQTGYSAEEAIGRNCKFLQGPGTDPNAISALRHALAARAQITIDLQNYRKDGTPFVNRLRVRPIYDEGGRLMFFAGVQNPVD